MTDAIDVLSIGNAIVDVIAPAPDAFLIENKLDKGSMRLIDADEATRIYALMPPGREVSGGSGANAAAGMAALGTKVAFVGRVAGVERARPDQQPLHRWPRHRAAPHARTPLRPRRLHAGRLPVPDFLTEETHMYAFLKWLAGVFGAGQKPDTKPSEPQPPAPPPPKLVPAQSFRVQWGDDDAQYYRIDVPEHYDNEQVAGLGEVHGGGWRRGDAEAPNVIDNGYTPNYYAYNLAFTNQDVNYAAAIAFLLGIVIAIVSYVVQLTTQRKEARND